MKTTDLEFKNMGCCDSHHQATVPTERGYFQVDKLEDYLYSIAFYSTEDSKEHPQVYGDVVQRITAEELDQIIAQYS